MTIGFFAPAPLALMIPFMATQSLAMGEAFGKGFQYGKRRVSSMTNEEFNKYTAEDMAVEIKTDYTKLIPHMEQAIKNSERFQTVIIEELTRIAGRLPRDVATGIFGGGDPADPGSLSYSNTQFAEDLKKFLLSGQQTASASVTPGYIADQQPDASTVPVKPEQTVQEKNLASYRADILKYNFSKYSEQQHLTNYPKLPIIIQNSRRSAFDKHMLTYKAARKLSRNHQAMIDRAEKYQKLVHLYSQQATNNRLEKTKLQHKASQGIDRRNTIRAISNLDAAYPRIQKKRADAQAILTSALNQVRLYERQRR